MYIYIHRHTHTHTHTDQPKPRPLLFITQAFDTRLEKLAHKRAPSFNPPSLSAFSAPVSRPPPTPMPMAQTHPFANATSPLLYITLGLDMQVIGALQLLINRYG